MTRQEADSFRIPLFFSRSTTTTEANRTGNWSFIRPAYRDRTAPCSEACPCGTDIARVETLASAGRMREAWQAILMENPLPASCGRVCFHPCEAACNRGGLDEPVSINALERGIAEEAHRGKADASVGRRKPSGRKIAIIGGGPAGLSAAYFLTRLGHDCEVFESASEAGGLLRWGIPEYRLPSPVLAREIRAIENLGVRIRCNEERDLSFPFGAGGYAAVVAACGQARAIGLRVPGAELAEDGLGFLRRTRSGPATALPAGTAAVIGGGNSAIDVARTLIRRGVKPVIVYRRRREDMPAFAHEIERALAEGAGLVELEAPLCLAREGMDIRISLQKMRSLGPGPDGRHRVEAVAGATSDLVVSAVYAAVGAEADAAFQAALGVPAGIPLGRSVLVPGQIPLAFAGDLTTKDKSVSDAIASGKEAALSLDILLREGLGAIEGRLAACRIGSGSSLSMETYSGGKPAGRDRKVVRLADLNSAYFPHAARLARGAPGPAAGAGSFEEAEAGLDGAQTVAEASRCMSCGTCNDCDNCRTFCPDVAVHATGTERGIDTDHCKGCGVCVEECPRGAMTMSTEEAQR